MRNDLHHLVLHPGEGQFPIYRSRKVLAMPRARRRSTPESTTKEIKGVCFLFSETGTEGGWWAVQEDGYTYPGGNWMYEGLRFLENGDEFTVYDKDGSAIWSGIIDQDDKTGAVPHTAIRKGKVVEVRGWKQQVVGGWWVHWIQRGMDPEEWGELFEGNKRCLIRRQDAITPDSAQVKANRGG